MSDQDPGMTEGAAVPMPKVHVTKPLASQLADMWSYSSDLRQALAFCDELARQPEGAPGIATTACWHALAIAYRRPFTTGRSLGAPGTARIRLPAQWIDELGGRDVHDWLLNLADRHISHQTGDSYHVHMYVLLNAVEPRGIAGVAHFEVRLVAPTEHSPDDIRSHLVALITAIEAEIARGEQLLVEQANVIGVDKLYRLAGVE